MKCKYCSKDALISKGKRGIKQRYQCRACRKYQQDLYSYKLFDNQDDKMIKMLNAEGVGINSISRILGYSSKSIIRRILYLSSKVVKPIYHENNQEYEVDELWTYVGKKIPSHYSWITYGINKKSYQVIAVSFGSRNKENLRKVIDSIKMYSPEKIITDKLNSYP